MVKLRAQLALNTEKAVRQRQVGVPNAVQAYTTAAESVCAKAGKKALAACSISSCSPF